jgi:hypothetical protein
VIVARTRNLTACDCDLVQLAERGDDFVDVSKAIASESEMYRESDRVLFEN